MPYLSNIPRGIALKTLFLACFLILVICTAAMAETSVWKATRSGSTIYLGGTIHLLRNSDYPLPPEFDKAFKAADVVMFETDIGLLNDPATKMKLMTNGVYSDGSTVEQHLSPKVYTELKSYTDANGIPLKQFNRFRPAILISFLTMLELKRLGVTAEGVDAHYYELAKKEKKSLKWLETADEQMNYLISCVDGHEDEFVSYSLMDLKDAAVQLATLTSAWRRGDAAGIDKLLVSEMKGTAPYVYKKLIVDRNRNWLPVITATNGTAILLVGVAHLVGEDGVIEALKRSGYRVEKL